MLLKNKKNGFTLIELLAVIVILAIVSVIGATTVLPYIKDSGKSAFAVEANHAIDAASQAMSLYHINSITSSDISSIKTVDTTTYYCFKLEKLVDLGLWTKDKKAVGDNGNYKGYVEVTKTSGSEAYSYSVTMTNGSYYVNSTGSNIEAKDIQDGDGSVTSNCPSHT